MGEDERIVLLVTLCIKLFTNSTGKSVKNNVLQALFCCFPRLHWKNDSITPNIKMLIWKHDLFNITHFGRKKKKKKREIEKGEREGSLEQHNELKILYNA